MAIKGKKVYVVFGSEDGDLGVYTNMKLAYEASLNYLCQNGDICEDECYIEGKASYSKACARLTKYRTVSIAAHDGVIAMITQFDLNI